MPFFDATLPRRRQYLLNPNYKSLIVEEPLIIEKKNGHAIIDTQHLVNNEKTKKTNLDLEYSNSFSYKFTLQDYKARGVSQDGDSFNVSEATIGFKALNHYIDLTTFSSSHNFTSVLGLGSKTLPAQVVFSPDTNTDTETKTETDTYTSIDIDTDTGTDTSANTTTKTTPLSTPVLKREEDEKEYLNLVNDILAAEPEISEAQYTQPVSHEDESDTQDIEENNSLKVENSKEPNYTEEEAAPEDLPAVDLSELDKREYLSLVNDILDSEIKQDTQKDLIINKVNGTARFIAKEQAMTAALSEYRQKDISNPLPTSYNIEVYKNGQIFDTVVFTFEEVENIHNKLMHLNEIRQLEAYNDELMQDYYQMQEQIIAEEFNTSGFGDISNIAESATQDIEENNSLSVENSEESDIPDVPTGGDAEPEVNEEQDIHYEYMKCMQQLLHEDESDNQDIEEINSLSIENSEESDEEGDEDSEYQALQSQYKQLQQQGKLATQDLAKNNSLKLESSEEPDVLVEEDAEPEDLPAAHLNEVDKREYLSLVNDLLDSEIKQDMQTPSCFINEEQALLNEFMRPLLREDLINKVNGAARFITKEQAMTAALSEHKQNISNPLPTSYNIEVYEDSQIIDAVVFTFEEVENIYNKLMHLSEIRKLKAYNDKLMQDYYEMQEQIIVIDDLHDLH
jgi:hypothetical protein